MHTLELILVLLGVVLASSIIDHSMSRVSLPLIQIGLGVIVALAFTTPFEWGVDAELFLVLFIAPILFDESKNADKRALWRNKGSIMSLAVGLVLVSVLAIGLLLHWMLPAIPLAACFALGAALGPTDAVAVSSLSKDVQLTERQETLLAGESLINDASGVVSFKFAIAAALTGTFSIIEAGKSLAYSFTGGVIVGVLLTLVIRWVMGTIRAKGLESSTTHVLFELCTPFIVFLAAESIHASGILAVVAAGLLIAFSPRHHSPALSEMHIASSSVWSILVFVMNGIVFVLLGTQLPHAISPTWNDLQIDNWWLILCVLAIAFVMIAARFLWVFGLELWHRDPATGKRGLSAPSATAMSSLITTLSGPKGAISLSIMFTIPFTIAFAEPFPFRDTLIFLASGVILCTLLIANFIVPLLAPSPEVTDESVLDGVVIEMLQHVIDELVARRTPQTLFATNVVLASYRRRISQLHQHNISDEALSCVRISVIDHQLDIADDMLAEGTATPEAADRVAARLERMRRLLTKHVAVGRRAPRLMHIRTRSLWAAFTRTFVELFRGAALSKEEKQQSHALMVALERAAIDMLVSLLDNEETELIPAVNIVLADHQTLLGAMLTNTDNPQHRVRIDEDTIAEIESEGLRLELEQIRSMRERNRITRTDAKELREQVYLMQMGMGS